MYGDLSGNKCQCNSTLFLLFFNKTKTFQNYNYDQNIYAIIILSVWKLPKYLVNVKIIRERYREQWAVYYTSTKTRFFYSLA